jgi:hypothetical protein
MKKVSKSGKTGASVKPLSNRAATTTIKVEGNGIDIEFIRLSAKQAKKILNQGISESELDDLISSSSTESGVCSAKVMVGGKTVGKFSIDKFKPTQVHKIGVGKAWCLVKEKTERGTFREILINKPFSAATLKVHTSFYDLNGFTFGYLDFSYGQNEGDFGETTPHHEGEWELLSPDGVRSKFDILDDEHEADSKEVTLELRCPSKESLRQVCAWLADGWEVTTRERADDRNSTLLVSGTKTILESVKSIVRRDKDDYGIVKTKWL